MSESKHQISEPSEKTRLNPFQTIFVIYGLVYGSFWLKIDTVFDMLKVNVTFFIITSAVVLVLTPVTLVYNHKFESCKSNIICCNCIALFAVGCFVYRLINILLIVWEHQMLLRRKRGNDYEWKNVLVDFTTFLCYWGCFHNKRWMGEKDEWQNSLVF